MAGEDGPGGVCFGAPEGGDSPFGDATRGGEDLGRGIWYLLGRLMRRPYVYGFEINSEFAMIGELNQKGITLRVIIPYQEITSIPASDIFSQTIKILIKIERSVLDPFECMRKIRNDIYPPHCLERPAKPHTRSRACRT